MLVWATTLGGQNVLNGQSPPYHKVGDVFTLRFNGSENGGKQQEGGDPMAIHDLAHAHHYGQYGMEDKTYESMRQARMWYRATYVIPGDGKLGNHRASGRGVEERNDIDTDMRIAMGLHRQATEQGHVDVRYWVGAYYAKGVNDKPQSFPHVMISYCWLIAPCEYCGTVLDRLFQTGRFCSSGGDEVDDELPVAPRYLNLV